MPVPGLTFARATHQSLYGTIASDWRIDGGRFVWKITVAARFDRHGLPAVARARCKGPEGLKPLGKPSDATVFELPAGSYTLVAPATSAQPPAKPTVACY